MQHFTIDKETTSRLHVASLQRFELMDIIFENDIKRRNSFIGRAELERMWIVLIFIKKFVNTRIYFRCRASARSLIEGTGFLNIRLINAEHDHAPFQKKNHYQSLWKPKKNNSQIKLSWIKLYCMIFLALFSFINSFCVVLIPIILNIFKTWSNREKKYFHFSSQLISTSKAIV